MKINDTRQANKSSTGRSGKYAHYYPVERLPVRQRQPQHAVEMIPEGQDGRMLLVQHLGLLVRFYRRIPHEKLAWNGLRRFYLIDSLLLVVFAVGVLVPVLQNITLEQRYTLAASYRNLIGSTNANLSSKLSFDPARQLYRFNEAGIGSNTTAAGPLMNLKTQLGGAGKQDKSLYSVDVPVDLSHGLTYYDNTMNLSFTLVPQFGTLPGREENGNLVYPLVQGGLLVYSFRANGLKEDVILDQVPTGGSLRLTYALQLPPTLQAEMVPGTGGVGVYAADPALFGNISFGSDADQSLVMKARVDSPKTHLVFVLPPPVIKQANGAEDSDGAHFTLRGNTLAVAAGNLSRLTYPLSIDPSVVITSSSDFGSGNNEGNISYPSGQMNRAGISGGTVGTWTTASSFTGVRKVPSSVAYNGYLYILGGDNSGTPYNDVQYAPINSDGTVGTWTATTSFTTARSRFGAIAYNGYLYVMGGDNGSAYYNDVQYAPINSDGTVGTWTATTSFTTARGGVDAIAYNGNLYILGGYNGTTYYNDVQYAPINANGTVGTWTATTSFTNQRSGLAASAYNGYLYLLGGDFGVTYYNDVQYAQISPAGVTGQYTATASFTTGRNRFAAVAYNGYLYVMGGASGASTYDNDVQYAPINSDGTVGTWTATTSFTTARAELAAVAYNGYLYIMGGTNGTSPLGDTQYAPINSDGTVGTWATNTTNFTNARTGLGAVAYNGYLYIMGGSSGGAGYYSDVQYAPINANGTVGTWTVSVTSFTNARYSFGTALYGKYIYIMGGQGTGGVQYNDVKYAPINSDGTVGTWTATTSFTTARFRLAAVAYNGYLYVTGGYDGTTFYNDVQYAPINSDGTVGTWSTTITYTSGRWGLAAAAYKGFMYIMGGQKSGGNNLNDTQYAVINNGGTGTAGTWTLNSTNFTTARGYFSSVAYNGYLYVMGGFDGTTYYNDVQYAPINANGTVGTWTATTSFPNVRYEFAAVAYNGYLYVMGGYNGSTIYGDVQVAQIGTAGALVTTRSSCPNGGTLTSGTWCSTTSLSSVRYKYAAVAYNGYLYVMGGSGNSGTLNDVQYAPINSDGTVGTWAATASFTTAREGLQSVAYNGYLYIMGGNAGLGYYNDVQYAPINANGTVGTWTATTSFTTGRAYFGATVYGGYLYVMGGMNTGTYYNDVQYAPLSTVARIGRYSKLIDLGSTYLMTSITYTGTLPGGLSAISYKIAGANGIFGNASTANVLNTSSGGCVSGPNAGRYIWLSLTVDDTEGAVYPDVNGTPGNVTDVTINYSTGHPPTNLRLRGGAWYSNQTLQPLDLCRP